MEIKSIFLIFGIGLAIYAVAVSFVGLRVKSFPNRGAMVGLLLVGIFLVAGTATSGIKLQIEEAHQREEGEKPIGEEANLTPLQIPANLRA